MILPYRRNVGAVLFARDGRVLVARRAPGSPASGAWQFPQGGIDGDERPDQAVFRELSEEIGTDHAEIIGEHPEWLTYDFPPDVQRVAMKGRFRGQMQWWFALRFTGVDSDIRLDAGDEQEFDQWRWIPLAETPSLAVSFKRDIYTRLTESFSGFAVPV